MIIIECENLEKEYLAKTIKLLYMVQTHCQLKNDNEQLFEHYKIKSGNVFLPNLKEKNENDSESGDSEENEKIKRKNKEIEEINNNNMTKGLMSSDDEENNNIYTIEKLPKNFTNYNKSIKIILLGDSGVGKTSLLKNLGQEESNINEYRTISLEYFNYNIKINNYIIRMQS